MSTWKVGDRVAYTRDFVRCVGGYAKNVADRRGTIVSGIKVQSSNRLYLRIQWDDNRGQTGTVLSSNVIHVDRLHLEAR